MLQWGSRAAIAWLALVRLSSAQITPEFHRTLTVTSAEVVTLDVDVPDGELRVSYGRDGEVSIAVLAKASPKTDIVDSLSPVVPNIEQSGNHIKIHVPDLADRENRIYRIEVPYRTVLTSRLNAGKQVITGILGPVNAVTNKGDIRAAYISKEVDAEVGDGNLDLQVIGGHVDAVAGRGDISGVRLPQGISAETGQGDVTLMVVGSSTAIVKSGTGRIDVSGARGSFVGSTDRGELHVKAIPHQDWQLNSASGDVRVELPPSAGFELECSTKTGEFEFDREDITKPSANVLQFHQAVNGGGKRIAAHTESGRIAIR
jgi:hypothetical protein